MKMKSKTKNEKAIKIEKSVEQFYSTEHKSMGHKKRVMIFASCCFFFVINEFVFADSLLIFQQKQDRWIL